MIDFFVLNFSVTLMLNGSPIVSIGGANGTTASNSILLPLNTRDRVWIELMRGMVMEFSDTTSTYSLGPPHQLGVTSFVGYRIDDISPTDIPSSEPLADFVYAENFKHEDDIGIGYPNINFRDQIANGIHNSNTVGNVHGDRNWDNRRR